MQTAMEKVGKAAYEEKRISEMMRYGQSTGFSSGRRYYEPQRVTVLDYAFLATIKEKTTERSSMRTAVPLVRIDKT